MNAALKLRHVRKLYLLNIRLFPEAMEAVALEYCGSYGSAAMAYARLVSEQEFRGALAQARRQPRFARMSVAECELFNRLFRAGAAVSELIDALDRRRVARAAGDPGA